METWNRLTVTRGEAGGMGECWKEGERISLGPCLNDPWTWSTVCGLSVGVGAGWAEEDRGGKLGQL